MGGKNEKPPNTRKEGRKKRKKGKYETASKREYGNENQAPTTQERPNLDSEICRVEEGRKRIVFFIFIFLIIAR